jgi:hypothetical protein
VVFISSDEPITALFRPFDSILFLLPSMTPVFSATYLSSLQCNDDETKDDVHCVNLNTQDL